MNNILTVKNVSKFYKNHKNQLFNNTKFQALKNVSLQVGTGKTLGIVGESGSGKSTLAKIMTAIETPSNGFVDYQSTPIHEMRFTEKKQYRREVQIVFQDSVSSLNPKKKVGWLLEEPLTIHKLFTSKNERRKKASEILYDVGLDDSFINRYPHELSGGQRQRVNIALALILRPTVVIADEPVSALDVSVQAQILNLLKSLQAEHNLTYIFISHDLDIVYYMSDFIAVMKDGEVVEYNSSEQIYFHSKHPYTRKLFSAKR